MGWNIIRGNHARQPRSSSPKRREFALFVFKIKVLKIFNPSIFFSIIKHLYTLRLGDSAKSYPKRNDDVDHHFG